LHAYKKETLYPIIESNINKDAAIVTDEYPGYDALKKNFQNATQIKSDKGKSFPILHQQIMNFKGWLRGIYHHCSSKHYQKFLDEYSFRTNRTNAESGIFRLLPGRSVTIKSKTYHELTAYAA
jgi:transposase-like protein